MTYSLMGHRWSDPLSISWSFGQVGVSPSWTIQPFKGEISDPGMRDVVRAGFEMWETVANVNFVEVPLGTGAAEPDVQIGFGRSVNVDQIGVAYNWMSGGQVEHSLVLLTLPGQNGWLLNDEGTGYGYHKAGQPVVEGSSLLWTVVHELGHVLGIDHSNDPHTAMAPVISRFNMGFTAEDISAVQSLYGAPQGWVTPIGPPPIPDIDFDHEDYRPSFDAEVYLRANPDVRRAGIDAAKHHKSFGVAEGRDGAVWFDDQFYLARNADVARSGMDPLDHYIRFGWDEGRTIAAAAGAKITGEGFDAQFYRMTNADVASSGMDPLQHYKNFGWREGRDPNAWFDTDGYLAANRDVAASGLDPLLHFHAAGWREGRDPSDAFDVSAYLTRYGDVAAANIDPLLHLMQYGLAEGRMAISDDAWL